MSNKTRTWYDMVKKIHKKGVLEALRNSSEAKAVWCWYTVSLARIIPIHNPWTKSERRVYCLFPYQYHTAQIILQGHAQGKNCKKTSAVSVQHLTEKNIPPRLSILTNPQSLQIYSSVTTKCYRKQDAFIPCQSTQGSKPSKMGKLFGRRKRHRDFQGFHHRGWRCAELKLTQLPLVIFIFKAFTRPLGHQDPMGWKATGQRTHSSSAVKLQHHTTFLGLFRRQAPTSLSSAK